MVPTKQTAMFNELINHPDRPTDLEVGSLVNAAKFSYDMFVSVCEALKPPSSILTELLNDPECSKVVKNYIPAYLQERQLPKCHPEPSEEPREYARAYGKK
jgi:hypothetical protein